MEKIISAVIGCGRMGAFTSESVKKFAPPCWFPLSHIEAIQKHRDLELDAICEINHDLLEKARKKYAIKKTYTDYRELIDEVKPSLLSIATRTIERPDIIEYAVLNGVNAIHMEKPICNSVKQINSLESLINKYNVSCTYGTIRRYFNVYRYAKKILDSGEYGDLQQIQVNIGAGQLFWTHPHSVDLILFMAGERRLESVNARLSNVIQGNKDYEIDSDPYIELANIQFSDGVVGSISKAGGCDLIMSCSNGNIIVEADGRRVSCQYSDGNDPYFSINKILKEDESLGDEGTYAAINQLVNNLKKEIEDRNISRFNKNIILGQRILFAFVQSHLLNGVSVNLDDLVPDLYVTGRTGSYYA